MHESLLYREINLLHTLLLLPLPNITAAAAATTSTSHHSDCILNSSPQDFKRSANVDCIYELLFHRLEAQQEASESLKEIKQHYIVI